MHESARTEKTATENKREKGKKMQKQRGKPRRQAHTERAGRTSEEQEHSARDISSVTDRNIIGI